MGQAQPKRTVLIVEDDAELRSLTAALLEDEHLDTIECESAEAALAVMLMREHDIRMIFADVRLPGVMDGVDLAWEVKQRWPAKLRYWQRLRPSAAAQHLRLCADDLDWLARNRNELASFLR